MFTWICPKCGQEVPPAWNECPTCAARAKTPEPAEPAPSPPSRPAAPPEPPPRAGGLALPAWMLSIIFTLAFLGLGAAAFFTVRHFGNRRQAAASPPIAFENPRGPGQAASNPLQKYIEVVGLRLMESGKSTRVRFVVVNHSEAEIADLVANVNLWARTAKSDEEAVGTFSFKLPSLGPNESKELTAPLSTKLRVYELPDWQNLNAEIQITSPR